MSDYLSKIESIGIEQKRLDSKDCKNDFYYSRLKKGMGLTIGNSMRRILLSKIPGYAIRFINIQGMQHEFNSIPGLKEEVSVFISNLRKIVFKGSIASSKAVLNFSKDGDIYASEIKGVNLEVVNKNLYLGNLSKNAAPIKLELHIEKNVGIITAKEAIDLEVESGSIICDSFFNPVIHANFSIENIEKDSEDVKISITTNGAVSPEEAFNYASEFMVEQISRNNSPKIEKQENKKQNAREVNIIASKLGMKVEDLPDVSNRALNCLHEMGIKYVGDLVKLTEKKLMDKPNFGRNSLVQLKEKLAMIGLKFDMEVDFTADQIEETDQITNGEFVL